MIYIYIYVDILLYIYIYYRYIYIHTYTYTCICSLVSTLPVSGVGLSIGPQQAKNRISWDLSEYLEVGQMEESPLC